MDITLERILSLIPCKEDGTPLHGERKKFAETIGLRSGNLISDWVNGRSKSYTNYLYEIAAKYDVSVEWLMGETDEKRPAPASDDEPPEITMIARAGKKMTPEQRDLMLQWAKLSFPEAFKDD